MQRLTEVKTKALQATLSAAQRLSNLRDKAETRLIKNKTHNRSIDNTTWAQINTMNRVDMISDLFGRCGDPAVVSLPLIS